MAALRRVPPAASDVLTSGGTFLSLCLPRRGRIAFQCAAAELASMPCQPEVCTSRPMAHTKPCELARDGHHGLVLQHPARQQPLELRVQPQLRGPGDVGHDFGQPVLPGRDDRAHARGVLVYKSFPLCQAKTGMTNCESNSSWQSGVNHRAGVDRVEGEQGADWRNYKRSFVQQLMGCGPLMKDARGGLIR